MSGGLSILVWSGAVVSGGVSILVWSGAVVSGGLSTVVQVQYPYHR